MPRQLNKTPLAEQLSMNPLVIDQSAASLFLASIQHLEQDERCAAEVNGVSMDADQDFWGDGSKDDWRTYYRPYNVANGILQIPIMGTLLDRFSFQFGRWATGYKYVEMALKRGLADGNVRGIALVIDSPGGEVSGCFELAAKIYEARSQKPIRAFAANHAYSAAYMLFASAEVGVVATSGGVGSIGVVTAHVSYAEALEKAGIKVTFIFAGAHKVDGNAYQDLPKAVKERIQTRINKIYGIFTSTVAKYRGMEEADVRATEALTYDAEEATENGLADKIGALEDEMAIFAVEAAETEGDEYMATPTQGNVTGKKAGDDENGIDQATYEKGCSDAKAAGVAEGTATGAKAERERIAAILGCEEAATKPKAAMNVAMKTDMSVEAAKAFLNDMPEEKASAQQPKNDNGKVEGRNHFNEAMDNGKNPNISAHGGKDDEDDGDGDSSESLLASFGAATGFGPKKKSA